MNTEITRSFVLEEPLVSKLDKYDRVILKNSWALSTRLSRLLDFKDTYITTISNFMTHVSFQSYPDTYEDQFVIFPTSPTPEYRKYYITYINCSLYYLQQLVAETPDTKILFQLRSNKANNFYRCIVRKIDNRWLISADVKELVY